MKNPSETTVKCFIPSSIPMCLRWLFPYKVKPLPIPIRNAFSYYLFQNKISLTIINWLFQGMRGMGYADLVGKICLEITVFSLIFPVISGSVLQKLVVSIACAHTFNWFFNSHFWVFGRYLGITRTSIERFPKYLRGVMNRLQNCPAIDSIIVIGGASRKEGVKITSDIDMFIIRKQGFLNGFIAVLITIKERILSFVTKFPLDLYLYDEIKTMDKHRDDERAFILKDVHDQVKAYYNSKGRKVAGFTEYERAAKKTA